VPEKVAQTPPPAVNPEAPSQPPADAAKSAAFRQMLSTARGQLAARNLDAANKTLEAAAVLPAEPADRTELARTKLLATYVERFWHAVREALKGLQITDELSYDGLIGAVVDSDAEGLTIHTPGVNHEYTLKNMPASLAMVLAERWFERSATSKLSLGAFQAVDPRGKRDEARRWWREAEAGGASAEDLMVFVDGPGAGASVPAVDLAAVPSKEQQALALRQIKETLQADYKSAKTPERKAELAQKLTSMAAETENPTDRYALLREAGDLAAGGGDPAAVVAAADELARWYAIDALEYKADGLARAAISAKKATVAREVAQIALALLDEAVQGGNARAAGKLGQAAVSGALKSKDAVLVKTARERNQQVQEMAK
jgi:hypothetical protein